MRIMNADQTIGMFFMFMFLSFNIGANKITGFVISIICFLIGFFFLFRGTEWYDFMYKKDSDGG